MWWRIADWVRGVESPGSARILRVGEGVLAFADFRGVGSAGAELLPERVHVPDKSSTPAEPPGKSSFRRNAETNAQDARATRSTPAFARRARSAMVRDLSNTTA